MRSYPEYQDVDVGWADRLPAHWEMRRAKRIFEEKDRPADEDEGVVTAFRDGEVTLRENRRTEGYTESLTKNNYQGIRKGDLVIHSMDAFAGAIGVSDSDGQASPVYVVCRPENEDEADVHFYKYLLRHMAWSGYIESLARGIRERSSDFRYSEFANQFLPVPPLQEQRAIAEELDEQTLRIDEYIAKKWVLIDLLETQRRAVINRAVTRGLDDGVEMTDSGVEWLGKIPAHWDSPRLKRLCTQVKDGLHQTPTKVESGVPFISTQHVRHRTVDWDSATYISREDYEKHHPNVAPSPGDVLITLVGSIGFPAIVDEEDVPFSCTRHVGYVRPKEGLLPEYLAYYFESSAFETFVDLNVSQTAQPSIYLASLSNHHIPLPPVTDQEQIVTYLDQRTSEIDNAIDQVEQQIELMKQYRTSLVAEVVTGQVDVRDPVAV